MAAALHEAQHFQRWIHGKRVTFKIDQLLKVSAWLGLRKMAMILNPGVSKVQCFYWVKSLTCTEDLNFCLRIRGSRTSRTKSDTWFQVFKITFLFKREPMLFSI